MTIRVRLFAWMAQRAGTSVMDVDLPPEATVAGVERAVVERAGTRLAWPAGTMVAVNQEYSGLEHVLVPGDEVAIIPPVSGG
jgi:molybdopterin converting factor subunit 1